LKPRIFGLVMLAIVSTSFLLFAKNMVLTTPDGLKIMLKDDKSWVFENGKPSEIEKDFTVPVSNGKIILIGTDGTWGYVEKEIKDEEKLIKTDSVVGVGHSVNRDITLATADAQKQALHQAVSRMKNALRQLEIDDSKLDDCVKRVEKQVDKKEDFKQGAGWDVNIRMVLDKGSIFAVADCAKKIENDSAKTAKKAKKK